MIALEDRQRTAQWLEAACRDGARLKLACEVAGIDTRTVQRWKAGNGLARGDGRPQALRPACAHALSVEERQRILELANEPRFAELPPARIVPMLADEGTYIASESSFSRVLRAHGQVRHRGRSKAPQRSRPPSTHVATGSRQLWCWDLTFLASRVLGQWFYLYVILDVYSRKIVGFEVHENDSSDHAVDLLRRTALSEGLHTLARKPVLHGDNGATMKATTVLAMLHWLGIKPSYSRPCVFRQCRPLIPADAGHRFRHMPARAPGVGVTLMDVGIWRQLAPTVSRFFFRMETPFNASRWPLWTSRSRMASASVGASI
jgi:putative transposase